MNIDKSDPKYIHAMLDSSDEAVEKAIVAIFNRQTEDEKRGKSTIHSNGVGFSGYDAGTGTYYAKWILAGNKLTRHHLVKGRKMAHKYVRQLSEIASIEQAKARLLQMQQAKAQKQAQFVQLSFNFDQPNL